MLIGKEPGESQTGSAKKLNLVLLLGGCLILLAVILAWFALERVQEKIQTDVGNALQTVLQTTQESLTLWAQNRKFHLTQIANNSLLVSLIERQLLVPQSKTALLRSGVLVKLRDFFHDNKDRFGSSGFYIINPDYKNIASLRDVEVGMTNVIALQRRDLISKVFQGESVMVPPLRSESAGKSAIMFFAAPIYDDRGSVIAVLAQRVNPNEDFTRLIQLGRIGKSGETYAFSKYGSLLSKSRFDLELYQIGLIGVNEESILSISIRDPGGNMVKGFRPSLPRYQQPLTLMAKQATRGQSGFNVEGYREYRGVRAYGAWLWDDNLGIGLATEIDEAEALSPYYTARRMIFTVLGITVLLALGSMVFAVFIDARANQALQKSHDELEQRVEDRTAELKESKDRLERAEERSRLLLESAAEGIFGVGEDGLVNFINPAALEMLGFKNEDVLGEKIHPLIHHTRPDGTPYPVEECPMYHSLTRGTIGNQDDEVLWRKDGTFFHAEYTSVPLRKDDSIIGTVVIFRDISERITAQEQLRKLSSATENSPATVVITDKDGTIEYVNPTFTEVTGYTAEEAIGNNPSVLKSGDMPASFYKDLWNTILSGEVWKGEFINRKKSGEDFWESASISPIKNDEGEITHFVAVKEDITEQKKIQETLRKSEELFRGYFENSQVGMSVTSPEKGWLEVNEPLQQMLGYSLDELRQLTWAELTHPDDLNADLKKFEQMLTGEIDNYTMDKRFLRKDGEIVYTNLTVSCIRDEDGAVQTIMASTMDITERKLAEEAIKNSQKHLAQIIDFLPDPTWVVDNDGKVVSWNRAIENLTGIKAADIVGKGDHEYAIPFYGERRLVLIDLIRDWEPGYEEKYVSVRREGENLLSESFHPHLGENGIYLSGIACLLHDASGNVTGAIESVRDITERKRSENELLEAKNRMQAVIDGVHSLVFIKDLMGHHLLVNTYFEEAFGLTKEEVIGKTDRDIFPPDVAREIMEIDRKVMTTGKPVHLEVSIPHQDGSIRIHLTEKFPLFDNEGEVYGMCGLATDITHQKDIEEELRKARMAADEANKAKGDFLANMSHEIRTPMNAVIGMAHLALKTDLTPKQQDYLTKIQSSANALLGIINDILDFSKIEAGKLDMESLEFNLDDVLDNLANLVTVKAQEKEELEVLFATGLDVPRFLVGDPLRLGQVLINLANNAVKFTEAGEIVVSAELVSQKDGHVELKFAVSDSGIGLTKDQMDKLFQSFSQADTSTTRKYGGTGLGLAISKKLVNMMDGEIWVESEYGQGSSFIFTATFGLGKDTVKKRFAPSKDLRGMKVLVVDDNATSREIFRDMLESFSFQVALAASGEEGLEEIEKAAPDKPFEMVIMDWKMPGMDGIEAARRIKESPELNHKPAIILVTAYGREEIMQQAEQVGLDGFLLKPVNSSTLFDATMQAFGKEVSTPARVRHGIGRPSDALKQIQGARVLLVEDNAINQQVAREILEGAGLHITLANNGKEAVDAVKQAAYDAVLMDVQMPVMDGYTATRKIREWEFGRRKAEGGMSNKARKDSDLNSALHIPPSEFIGLPIIAMTAHAMAGDEEKSLEAGMNGHVTKPIDPDQLFATLGNWIRPDKKITQVQRPETKPALAAESELPETLPGFDLTQGLQRLQGNHRLYRKLLLDFGVNYAETAAEIHQKLDAGDYDQAHGLIHNIKGLAGNLAATNLQEAAQNLETLVKNRSDKTPSPKALSQKFSHFEDALNKALLAVHVLGSPADKTIVESPDAQNSFIPPEIAAEIAARLQEASEMGDVTTLTAIAEELKKRSEACTPLGNQIVQLAEDFDFDGITKLAGELAG